ncbi:uncharacterized protein LOC105030528 [Esox lucius]|uniref:FBA domain-containing protein n=1 Tax=Esox lucius TaxID=8010 RepID=A0A3P8ZQ46_ESOLU|nr:uncharacterized protein LOC105030528 [Esox lucius]
MEFWELTRNGGDGWAVEELPGDCGYNSGKDKVTRFFATSFELCLKKQVVDLLAEGFSPEDLNAQPAVTVKDYYSRAVSSGCVYMLTVHLLDNKKKVIKEFKPEPVTLNTDRDDMSWRQVSHTFSDYGPGLRFISFEHGGNDTKCWKGHYGVRVTGSSVTIKTTKATPARNLLKNINGNANVGAHATAGLGHTEKTGRVTAFDVGAEGLINCLDNFDRPGKAFTKGIYEDTTVYAYDGLSGKTGERVPKAGALAEAGVGLAKAEWSFFDAEAKGPNASAEASASVFALGAMARAEVGSVSANAGPFGAKLGLGFNTGVSAGVDGVEVKLLGTGIKLGPSPSISVLGSEVSCSIL